MSEHEELNQLKSKYNELKASYSNKAYKHFQVENTAIFLKGFFFALLVIGLLGWIER